MVTAILETINQMASNSLFYCASTGILYLPFYIFYSLKYEPCMGVAGGGEGQGSHAPPPNLKDIFYLFSPWLTNRCDIRVLLPLLLLASIILISHPFLPVRISFYLFWLLLVHLNVHLFPLLGAGAIYLKKKNLNNCKEITHLWTMSIQKKLILEKKEFEVKIIERFSENLRRLVL